MTNRTMITGWKKHDGMTWSTILLTMSGSLWRKFCTQQDGKARWVYIAEENKSKVKLNFRTLQDEMSAVRFSA